LPAKVKEFVYIAIDAATTHIYKPGLRIHIRNAMNHGATKEEILEIFQLISTIGIHTCTEGVPILLDELEKAAS
jgi:alkylhydroperoxidase/carboxymuconolactone decarboxylase family protein YurZ